MEEASKKPLKVKKFAIKLDDPGSVSGTHVIWETDSGKLFSDLHTANKWISKCKKVFKKELTWIFYETEDKAETLKGGKWKIKYWKVH